MAPPTSGDLLSTAASPPSPGVSEEPALSDLSPKLIDMLQALSRFEAACPDVYPGPGLPIDTRDPCYPLHCGGAPRLDGQGRLPAERPFVMPSHFGEPWAENLKRSGREADLEEGRFCSFAAVLAGTVTRALKRLGALAASADLTDAEARALIRQELPALLSTVSGLRRALSDRSQLIRVRATEPPAVADAAHRLFLWRNGALESVGSEPLDELSENWLLFGPRAPGQRAAEEGGRQRRQRRRRRRREPPERQQDEDDNGKNNNNDMQHEE